MNIIPVTDPAFAPYGRVVTGYPVDGLLKALEENTPCPEGTVYFPKVDALHAAPDAAFVGDNLFGGMPYELGCCNGHNTRLNCLEYHRDSEFNLGTEDFILLLAKMDDIENDVLDTAKVYPAEWAILALVFAIAVLPTVVCTFVMARRDGIEE